MHDSIGTADLVIYAVLILPTIYCLFRHARYGILGWAYLVVFCSLRIIGGALSISNGQGIAAKIISSVALSPLLLAATGLLHEVRVRGNSHIDLKLEWIVVLVVHMIVGAGVALTAVGISGISSTNSSANDMTFIKAGVALLTFSWVFILILAVFTMTLAAYRHTLLFCTVFAVPWIGVRVIYTLVAFTTQRISLNPITGTLAVRVVLGLVPELIATLSFLAGGLLDPPQSRRQKYPEHRHRHNVGSDSSSPLRLNEIPKNRRDSRPRRTSNVGHY
ncbi:hypothetical protein QM012_002175 [Aureobasidium pullulans]|uniref:DUF7702 domain-containing protein n=1 Tax=Aureobasidium pullulans TaxID=5580 RepID=A0ABR0TCM6_AURPU